MIKSCLQTLCSSFNLYVKHVCSVCVPAVCVLVLLASDFAVCLSVRELRVVYFQLLDDVETAVLKSVCFKLGQKDQVLFGCLKKKGNETTKFFLTALIKSVDLMMIDWENSKEIILMMLFLLVELS